MNSKIFHLHALSALHVGTGQGIGTVDLPIARAKATHLPLVPGSSLKGVLRDGLNLPDLDTRILFGPESTANTDAHAGALAIGDAHLLLLPVRSFAGTMAYATCPFVLRQYARDAHQSGTPLKIPAVADTDAQVTSTSKLLINQQVVLEDLDLHAKTSAETTAWAKALGEKLFKGDEVGQRHLMERLVILSDSTFSFLADTATEIRMRIRINRDTRTVQQGALWSEENLPAESVLWGVIGIARSRFKEQERSADEVAKLLPREEKLLQIGGKHTVGRGLCRFLVG